MPPLPLPSDENLKQAIRGPAYAVSQVAQQQNKTIVNAQGQPVINEGLVPGSSPAAYGWQFVDPSTGNPRMFVGEDGAGNAYIAFYDANGNITTKIDTQGVHILNTSGQEEARLGQLNASPAIYGLGVAPATGSAPGTLQQVGGSLFSRTSAQVTTASTSWTSFADDPSVTAEIGPSGAAYVTIGASIATSADVNSEGFIGLRIDSGTSPATPATAVLSNASSTGVNATVGTQQVITGLSTGSHTFSLLYETANVGAGHVIGFSGRYVLVQPL